MEIEAFKNFFSEDEWEQVLDEKKDSHESFFHYGLLKRVI